MKHRTIIFLVFILIFNSIATLALGISPSNSVNKDTLFLPPDSLDLVFDTINKTTELAGIDDTVTLFSNKHLNDQACVEKILKDSPIASMLDSLVKISFFTNDLFVTDTSQLNIYNYARNVVPEFADSVYEARISMLSGQTPFEMTYNQTVRGFIELYSVRKRGLTSRMPSSA